MTVRRLVTGVLIVLAATVQPLRAQESVGKRFFPDQLVIAESFVEDELSLPSILSVKRGRSAGERSTRLTDFGGEIKKRITADFELSVGGGLALLEEKRGTRTGFENLNVGMKYEFFRNIPHEVVASLSLQWELGDTGKAAIGAASFDTVSPSMLVGKGFGDLPERLAMLRPLAISGLFGFEIPVRDQPTAIAWGGVIEYSLPYLTEFVRDVGLPSAIKRLVPIVETDLRTDVAGRLAGRIRGTVNPGVIWVGDTLQIGIEAVAPIDPATGHGLGVRAFVRIPLEVLFGRRAGEPLFR